MAFLSKGGRWLYLQYFRSHSAKVLVGSWWLFILLIVNFYAANMAAFLTVKRATKLGIGDC